MTIACPKCQLRMVVIKTGVFAEEMADFGSYKLWSADLFRCPNCNCETVANFAGSPIAEHFQVDYKRCLERWPPPYRYFSTQLDKERFQRKEAPEESPEQSSGVAAATLRPGEDSGNSLYCLDDHEL